MEQQKPPAKNHAQKNQTRPVDQVGQRCQPWNFRRFRPIGHTQNALRLQLQPAATWADVGGINLSKTNKTILQTWYFSWTNCLNQLILKNNCRHDFQLFEPTVWSTVLGDFPCHIWCFTAQTLTGTQAISRLHGQDAATGAVLLKLVVRVATWQIWYSQPVTSFQLGTKWCSKRPDQLEPSQWSHFWIARR